MLDQAFARDGFRCMITGMLDTTSLKRSAELRCNKDLVGGVHVSVVTSHILNESMAQGTSISEENAGGQGVYNLWFLRRRPSPSLVT